MSVFHPFSAASKPIQDWDSLPSRPLRFAATFDSGDASQPDAPSTSYAGFPRPRRQVVEGSDFDRRESHPVSFRSRYDGLSSPQQRGLDRTSVLGSPNTRKPAVGSDEWMQLMVAHCVDNAKCDLELSDCGLERLSTKISDLQHLVTLPRNQSPKSSPSSRFVDGASPSPRRLDYESRLPSTLSNRSFARTQSAPASASFFTSLNRSDSATDRTASGLFPAPRITNGHDYNAPLVNPLTRDPLNPGNRRRFQRSKTGAADFSKRTVPNIAIYLSQNRLTSLPSALFEIQYLTVLSLRNNQLTTLPAAVGELTHLKELNISNNKIEYLPSTMLNLSLEQFSAHNNKWLPSPLKTEPSEGQAEAEAPTLSSLATRVISPIRSLCSSETTQDDCGVPNIPRLTSLCLTVLLSPRGPSGLPPLIDYPLESWNKGGIHPLLDAGVLRDFIGVPTMPPSYASRILQSVKSACAAAAQSPLHTGLIDPFPRSYLVPEADDASTNPYYYPCPSTRHQWHDGGDEPITRRIFLDAAEERFEWITILGEKNLPIRWLGCSPGCLEFLDDEDELFGLDGLDELDFDGQ